jgi:16S rRNA processing protein RimM
VNPAPRIRVALVRRPHGLAGELLVESLTDRPARFRRGTVLHAGARQLTVRAARPMPGGLALKLDGVDDREAAAALRGAYLEVEPDAVEPLAPGRYYHWQLVGLRALDAAGHDLGEVVDVQEYPANDIVIVRGPAGEVLVPALKSVVVEVNLDEGRMVVDLPAADTVQ